MEPGTQLGPYEIKEPLGEGGMGRVYRAHDGTLRRDVALKLLPGDVADDPQRLARLKREARSLAALNHPHIASVHGFEEQEGTSFIVMELVEGRTLAEKLEGGSLPVREALELGIQVAQALEAAHERGIVHRDLKPANVKITPSGEAKVLDFGLAKPAEREKGSSDTEAPTATVKTRTGAIMGTPPYMSPEQIRGEEVDQRTDIWAFGCLLYEMLTGRGPFTAETAGDTMSAILSQEPEWDLLPPETPGQIRSLLRRCLSKDPERRWHHSADARIEIEEALEGPAAVPSADTPSPEAVPTWRRMLPWAVGALMLLLAAIALDWSMPSPAPEPVWVPTILSDGEFHFPESNRPELFAISPDGSQLVYLAPDDGGGGLQLYRKRMEQLRATAIRGTEGAVPGVFFSPDGQWIGFPDGNRLWRIPLEGGSPLPISDLPNRHRGASWGPDDTIVLTDGPSSGLMRVPAGGGDLEPLTELKPERGERSHRWPQWLPGGEAVLFNVGLGGSWNEAEIAVVSVETGERRTLPVRGMDPRYVSSGHLLYGRGGALFAVPFDPERLEVTGSPASVVDDAITDFSRMGAAHYAVSNTGTLVYVAVEGRREDELVLFDRAGRIEPIELPPASYGFPSFSPDGRYLALDAALDQNLDVYVHDLERNSLRRITTHEATDELAVWTPDSERLIFSRLIELGGKQLFSIPLDGSAPATRLLESRGYAFPSSVSPDGRVLLYWEQAPNGDYDIKALPLTGDPEPRTLMQAASEQLAVFSPDGRVFAYNSNESGRDEVYVRPYPEHSAWRRQISTQGGRFPRWGPDGSELFYREGDRLMVVSTSTEPEFSAERPRPLFEARVPESSFDVTPDGEQFVFARVARPSTLSMRMVLNWFEDLKRRVPAGR